MLHMCGEQALMAHSGTSSRRVGFFASCLRGFLLGFSQPLKRISIARIIGLAVFLAQLAPGSLYMGSHPVFLLVCR